MPNDVLSPAEIGADRLTYENPNQQLHITEEDVRDLKATSIAGRKYTAVKRGLDIVLSALGLAILLLPMAIIALIILLDSPGGVFFTQYRVGQNGREFRLYKFRTMKRETPEYLSTIEVDRPEQYITRVGGILRRLSLDELPQLFNVLKGDMSLVGPRPLIAQEQDMHKMRARFGVYSLKPGLTGLAQINGRDTVSPVEKLHWDVKYLEKYGFLLDIRIVLSTVPKVFGGCGVVEGCAETKQDVEL